MTPRIDGAQLTQTVRSQKVQFVKRSLEPPQNSHRRRALVVVVVVVVVLASASHRRRAPVVVVVVVVFLASAEPAELVAETHSERCSEISGVAL